MGKRADVGRSETTTEEAFDNLVEEITDKLQGREVVDIEQYARRYPLYAARLRELFPTLQAMATFSLSESNQTTSALPTLSEQNTLGDFIIKREIGRGGMGVVYEAEQISLGRRIALKVLPFAPILDKTQLTRFKNEARAAASLDHPNVVGVLSVGNERGVHYYAMQFIEGQTVADVIAEERDRRSLNEKPSPASAPRVARGQIGDEATQGFVSLDAPAEGTPEAVKDTVNARSHRETTRNGSDEKKRIRGVVALGVQAAEALEHAHRMGIVHRDIKPSNLMVDEEAHLWITDFGLALVEVEGNLTASGSMVGTLRYMSPEQMHGDRRVLDHRTDVYSLGATLYEMLVLQPAFPDAEAHQLLQRVPHDDPPSPGRLNNAIPRDLETIVLKAMAREARFRYATAQELADDLRRFLADEPIRARRAGLIDKARKWTRRHQAIVTTAIVTLVAVLAVSAVLLQREAHRFREQWKRAETAETAVREEAVKAKRSAAVAETINRFVIEQLLTQADPRNNPASEQTTLLEVLDAASKKLDAAFPDQPQIKVALNGTIAETYYRLGNYAKAETHFRTAEEISRREFGEDDATTVNAAQGRGRALYGQGRLEEAVRLLEQCLTANRRLAGDDDPQTLSAMRDLARVLTSSGQLAAAESLARRCQQGYARVAGSTHPDTAMASVCLAAVLEARGDHQQSEQLLRSAVEILRDARGPEHPDTLVAIQQLASTLQRQEKPVEAEQLLREVLAAQLRVYGADHPATVQALAKLADFWLERGKLSEVETIYRRLVDIQRRVFGPRHLATVAAVGKLAEVVRDQGQLDEAEKLYRQILGSRPATSDANRADTLSTVNDLASVLQDQGEFAESEPLLRQNLTNARQTHGPVHRTTYISINRLIISLLGQGKIGEAEEFARENLIGMGFPDDKKTNAAAGTWEMLTQRALQLRDVQVMHLAGLQDSLATKRETLAPGHLSVATTLSAFGQGLVATGRLQQAEPMLRECLAIRQRSLPDGHWLTTYTTSLLGDCVAQLGRYAEAEPLLLKSYQTLASGDPRRPVHQLDSLKRLVTLYDRWEKPDQANRWRGELVKLLRECTALWQESVPEGHWLLANSESQLGGCLSALGNHAEAEPLLLRSYVTLETAPPPLAGYSKMKREAIQRIIRFYERTNRAERLSKWQTLETRYQQDEKSQQFHEISIEIGEQLVRENPSESLYRVYLGRWYGMLGGLLVGGQQPQDALLRFDEAVSTLATVAATEPENKWAFDYLSRYLNAQAQFLQTLGRDEKAIACYERAIEADAQPRTLRRLALLLADSQNASLRDLPRAVELAEQAAQLSDRDHWAWVTLGIAHYRSGNWKAAAEALRKATLFGGSDLGYFFQAMAHWQLSDEQEARKWYAAGLHALGKRKTIKESSQRARAEAAALLGLQDASEPDKQDGDNSSDG